MTTLPETMTAIGMAAPGGPEVLRPETRPVPKPGPGQILVAIAAAGVNRPDVLQRQGGYNPPPGASDIPGLEFAGTVVAQGEGANRFPVGAAVCGGGGGGLVEVPDGAGGVELVVEDGGGATSIEVGAGLPGVVVGAGGGVEAGDVEGGGAVGGAVEPGGPTSIPVGAGPGAGGWSGLRGPGGTTVPVETVTVIGVSETGIHTVTSGGVGVSAAMAGAVLVAPARTTVAARVTARPVRGVMTRLRG